MKEEDIYLMVKEGTKSPSDDFTEKLMEKIEAPGSFSMRIRSKLNIMYLAFPLIFVLFLFVELPDLNYGNHTIAIPSVYIRIVGAVVILFLIHQVLEIKQQIRQLENHTG